ncbi:hypothetical protein GCM10023238_02030 [Streptomyces heliomycini]
MYGLAGERRLPESELPWLSGFGRRHARADRQRRREPAQLDVYGEVMDSLALARSSGLSAQPDVWALQSVLMDSCARRGGSRTRGCGRCAAAGATSCTPR